MISVIYLRRKWILNDLASLGEWLCYTPHGFHIAGLRDSFEGVLGTRSKTSRGYSKGFSKDVEEKILPRCIVADSYSDRWVREDGSPHLCHQPKRYPFSSVLDLTLYLCIRPMRGV